MTRSLGSNWPQLAVAPVSHSYLFLTPLSLHLCVCVCVCVTAQGGNLLWAVSDWTVIGGQLRRFTGLLCTRIIGQSLHKALWECVLLWLAELMSTAVCACLCVCVCVCVWERERELQIYCQFSWVCVYLQKSFVCSIFWTDSAPECTAGLFQTEKKNQKPSTWTHHSSSSFPSPSIF